MTPLAPRHYCERLGMGSTPDVSPDAALLSLSEDQIFEGLREVANAREQPAEVMHVLERAGLVEGAALTPAGSALHKLRWVVGDIQTALIKLGEMLRPLLPVQVMEQELRGYGPVPEEGVLELLQVHRAAPPSLQLPQARAAFKSLTRLGLVVYSQKFKSLRFAAPPDADAAAVGEDDRLAALVSPRTPFTNVVRLRRILRRMRGTVWWVDKHFGARALEDLVAELAPDQVNEVRILSGSATNVLTDRSYKDLQRFVSELSLKGVAAEWRVADDATAKVLHDRWLVDDHSCYNLPPVNSFYSNQWSEILASEGRPPIADWWRSASPRTS